MFLHYSVDEPGANLRLQFTKASSPSFNCRVPRGTQAPPMQSTPTTLTATSRTSGGRSTPTTAGGSGVPSEFVNNGQDNMCESF